jgi:hypothetical protein
MKTKLLKNQTPVPVDWRGAVNQESLRWVAFLLYLSNVFTEKKVTMFDIRATHRRTSSCQASLCPQEVVVLSQDLVTLPFSFT